MQVDARRRFPVNGAVEVAGATPVPTMAAVLQRTERRLRAAQATHLGYPYNLVARSRVPAGMSGLLVNNLGDPYVGSHFGSEVCELELEVVAWLQRVWRADPGEAFWGSVVASGTEGNLWALYLAREARPVATLLHSDAAHYSIPKAARLLRMPAVAVPTEPGGAIDPEALASAARAAGTDVVVALTCGTTMTGAHDDIAACLAALDRAGVTAERRFVHVDGALNAMVIPFLDDAPEGIRPGFDHAIDSLSTSGHKMIGTPMPCGVLVARRPYVDRVAAAVSYLRSDDTTLMGSRNGHAVLAVWERLIGHGEAGFRRDAAGCLARAARLATDLTAAGVPVVHNPWSLTLVFPQPAESVVNRYQLACSDDRAHAIVMPNVGDALLSQFRGDYLAWWSAQRS